MDGSDQANTDTDTTASDDAAQSDQAAAKDNQPADDKSKGDQAQNDKADNAGSDKKADADKAKADESKDVDKDKSDGDSDDSDKKDGTDKDQPEGAPEEYADFTLAEGAEVNETVLGEFKSFAKDLNLTQEQAQRLVDFQQTVEVQRAEAFQEQVNAWVDSAKNDKEFGGKQFEENTALANEALKEYGTAELITLLKDTRMGNHPEVIRTFYRIGKALKEGSSARSSSSSGGPKKLTDIYK